MIPRHPCLRLVSNCEQTLSSHTSRRLITMEKMKEPEVCVCVCTCCFLLIEEKRNDCNRDFRGIIDNQGKELRSCLEKTFSKKNQKVIV